MKGAQEITSRPPLQSIAHTPVSPSISFGADSSLSLIFIALLDHYPDRAVGWDLYGTAPLVRFRWMVGF